MVKRGEKRRNIVFRMHVDPSKLSERSLQSEVECRWTVNFFLILANNLLVPIQVFCLYHKDKLVSLFCNSRKPN